MDTYSNKEMSEWDTLKNMQFYFIKNIKLY
jgi:hypothetical protein